MEQTTKETKLTRGQQMPPAKRRWRPGMGTAMSVIFVLGVVVYSLARYELINNYYVHILTLIAINVILVASLNLVNGYLGEFAIGHAGFMAVGAYASSVVTVMWHQNFYLALLAGGLTAALIGWLVAIPSFKTFGDYLAIVTLGFNMIIVNLIQNLDVIGGPRGFGGMPRATNLIVAFVMLIVTLVVLRNLVYSNYGRIWQAIRENDIAAEMMGIDVTRYKILAFTIAAFFAGTAGALAAHYFQFIHPSSFTYIRMTDILVMLYLGGMGSLSGSVLGASALTLLLELLRPLGVWRMVFNPLILIAVMLFKPYGFMGNREFGFVPQREEVPQRVASGN